MKLSDVDIERAIERGEIGIDPLPPEESKGSFSIDLTLADRFRVFDHSQHPFIDLANSRSVYAMSEKLMLDVAVKPDEAFYLHPGELALGVTRERVRLPDTIVGWLDGRSSLARLGLMVHITAHTIDPGWDGQITLEFYNSGRFPLALRPGMRICALSFEPLSSPTSRPYTAKKGAKYANQDGPLASRIDRDKDE
ncbi:MAG: dCTP deaminase [Gammaproteobacteria bacterium]|nr:dCTP deaminase [Gammaproteobacteria bacterium]MCP5137540.1 dCTP deaminase [Gammaproteobacteria bacterium]